MAKFYADQLNLAITIHISIAPSMICQQIIALGTGRIWRSKQGKLATNVLVIWLDLWVDTHDLVLTRIESTLLMSTPTSTSINSFDSNKKNLFSDYGGICGVICRCAAKFLRSVSVPPTDVNLIFQFEGFFSYVSAKVFANTSLGLWSRGNVMKIDGIVISKSPLAYVLHFKNPRLLPFSSHCVTYQQNFHRCLHWGTKVLEVLVRFLDANLKIDDLKGYLTAIKNGKRVLF